MRKIPLHIQILIGFVLGIAFGAIFGINHHEIKVGHKGGEASIENWHQVSFVKGDSTLRTFGESSQVGIIKFFESLKKDNRLAGIKLIAKTPNTNESPVYEEIRSVTRESSIGVDIKPFGEIFIRLLNMIAVPLVLASLIVGAASLNDIKHIAKLGGKLMVLFLATGCISVALGQVLAVTIQPGMRMSPESKTQLIESYKDEVSSPTIQNYNVDLIDFAVNIIPKNPFKAGGW